MNCLFSNNWCGIGTQGDQSREKIVCSEICPNIYENLGYDKGSISAEWGKKMKLFIKGCWGTIEQIFKGKKEGSTIQTLHKNIF